MDWNDLSLATRSSEKLRFNKLCDELKALDNRVQALEGSAEITVELKLADTYTNPTLTFDGSSVTKTGNKYLIKDVKPGVHTVACTCSTWKNFSKEVTFSASSNEYTITLEPNIINVTATVTLDDEPVEGASVSATGVTAVTTDATGKAVLSKQADSISGVTATVTIDDTVYSATSDSSFTEDGNVALALTAEESE